MPSPPYKKALITGGTSGIGLALAEKLLSLGTKVIITGRRTSNLSSFATKHGSSNTTTITQDVSSLSSIPSFAASILHDHPDLDLVVFNAGVQRGHDFTSPSLDLGLFDSELTTNYTSVVHLFAALAPELARRGTKCDLVFVSATLGLVPTMVRSPGYNASKAALHSWILNVREQVRRKPGWERIKLVEVLPPAVQTELHDERHQPDLVNGGGIGMPLDVFTEKMWEGIMGGEECVAVGEFPEAVMRGPEKVRLEMYRSGMGKLEEGLKPFMKS